MKINKVIITELKDATYYAEIHLTKGKTAIKVDARPSDSIVLALATNSPIYVNSELSSQMIELKKIEEGLMGTALKNVLDNIEDTGKYKM
mgnify:CR=1 FL=1